MSKNESKIDVVADDKLADDKLVDDKDKFDKDRCFALFSTRTIDYFMEKNNLSLSTDKK
jgi:hypothetical protein